MDFSTCFSVLEARIADLRLVLEKSTALREALVQNPTALPEVLAALNTLPVLTQPSAAVSLLNGLPDELQPPSDSMKMDLKQEEDEISAEILKNRIAELEQELATAKQSNQPTKERRLSVVSSAGSVTSPQHATRPSRKRAHSPKDGGGAEDANSAATASSSRSKRARTSTPTPSSSAADSVVGTGASGEADEDYDEIKPVDLKKMSMGDPIHVLDERGQWAAARFLWNIRAGARIHFEGYAPTYDMTIYPPNIQEYLQPADPRRKVDCPNVDWNQKSKHYVGVAGKAYRYLALKPPIDILKFHFGMLVHVLDERLEWCAARALWLEPDLSELGKQTKGAQALRICWEGWESEHDETIPFAELPWRVRMPVGPSETDLYDWEKREVRYKQYIAWKDTPQDKLDGLDRVHIAKLLEFGDEVHYLDDEDEWKTARVVRVARRGLRVHIEGLAKASDTTVSLEDLALRIRPPSGPAVTERRDWMSIRAEYEESWRNEYKDT